MRVAWLLLFCASMTAQTRTSAITGLILDASGEPVTGVRVKVVSVERGWSVETHSGTDGYYRVSPLEPGTYAVTASQEGFQSSELKNVTLALDRETRLVHRLAIMGRAEMVTVQAQAASIDASASTIASLIDQRRIMELPLNGRDYLQLAALQSGVIPGRAQSRDGNTGFGQQISISGSRPGQNSVRLDGVHVTNQTGGAPGSLLGVNLGVEAIREFSVSGSTFNASQGRAAGGVIHAVTRSGTNEMHGSAYYFHRNSAVDAHNYFDPGKTAPFRRHQWGGSLGGPVRKDRTFFFANFESLTELQARTAINTTVSDAARSGRLGSGAVTVDPAASKLLALWPSPNAGVLGDTGLFSFFNPVQGREHFVTSRLDHHLGRKDTLFLRYTFDDAATSDLTNFALARRNSQTGMHSASAEWAHTASPSVLQTTRFGWLRSKMNLGASEAIAAGLKDPSLGFFPSAPGPGLVTITGLTGFQGGSDALDRDQSKFDSYQFYEDFSWQRGRHLLRVGASVELTRFDFTSATTPMGEFTFTTLSDFLRNRPQRYKAPMPGTDSGRLFSQELFAWYVQDSVRLSRRVQMDIGLRHEWISVPREANGKMSNLDRLTDAAPRTTGPLFRNPSLRNFAPRAGLAWDIAGDGSSVLRGGYGIYHDQILSQYLLIVGVRNPPYYLYADARNLPVGSFPTAAYESLLSRPTIDLRMERLDPAMKQPYVQQWNASLQQRLPGGMNLRAAYAGSHGLNLSTLVEDANLVPFQTLADGRMFFPAGAPKLNPNFGLIRDRLFNGHSFYHSLQTELSRQWTRGTLQAAYTWSKSIDDDSSTFARTDAANSIGIPVDGVPGFNRGLSNHDVRHMLTVHALWALPGPKSGIWRVFGGWQWGGLVSAGSGMPFSPVLGYDAARTGTSRPDYRGGQRPDVNPSFSGSLITGDPSRWFRPEAFLRPTPGFLGNAGRNILTGPGYFSADTVLSKDLQWPGSERFRTTLRLEAFNLTNRANFDLPGGPRSQVFTQTAIPEDVGRITTAGPARKLQAGVRISF